MNKAREKRLSRAATHYPLDAGNVYESLRVVAISKTSRHAKAD